MSKRLTELTHVRLDAPIKLAFFDIDGTLLCQQGHYGSALKKQLVRLRECGVKTAIASGRPQFAAQFLIDELNLCDTGVFCTGAYIYEPLQQRRHLASPVAAADALALISYLRQSRIYYELYTGDRYFYETETAQEIRCAHSRHLRTTPVQADLAAIAAVEPVFKFIVGVDQRVNAAELVELEQAFPHLHFAYASMPAYPDWRFANVIDSRACKHRAFDWLLAHYQLQPENVASFGDSHSDEIFLQRAGVGVAMGNACESARQVARFITKNAWDDGVAYALARLVQ